MKMPVHKPCRRRFLEWSVKNKGGVNKKLELKNSITQNMHKAEIFQRVRPLLTRVVNISRGPEIGRIQKLSISKWFKQIIHVLKTSNF